MPEHEDPSELLNPEEFAKSASLSVAFVRLVIECGCPVTDGRLSQSSYVNWLTENFPLVRTAAGLPALPAIQPGVSKEEWAKQVVNGCLRTVMDFSTSRCSDPEIKQAYQGILTDRRFGFDDE